jgi:hypothetical protein
VTTEIVMIQTRRHPLPKIERSSALFRPLLLLIEGCLAADSSAFRRLVYAMQHFFDAATSPGALAAFAAGKRPLACHMAAERLLQGRQRDMHRDERSQARPIRCK